MGRLRGFYFTLLILILTLFFNTSSIATIIESQPTAAVLSFRVDGLSESAGEALANVVRSVIIDNGRVTLIDRDRTDAVLTEHGLIMAGGCYDVSCLIEAGKVLGAERVITGSVNRLGRKYMVELRSAHVGSGRIEALETMDYTGDVEGLTDPARDLAKQLLARLINAKGLIVVETEPEACAIEINDEPVGFAPLRIEKPGGIRYTVSAIRLGYEEKSRSFVLQEDDTTLVRLELDRYKEKKRYREPTVRVLISGGLPLDQASSNLDSKISWGGGESYGAMMQIGTDWRLSFGGYVYSSVVDEIDNEEFQFPFSDAIDDPHGDALVYFSSLTLMLGGGGFYPFIGGGLSAMERTISYEFIGEEKQKKTTDFEIGWIFHAGFEIAITRAITTQIELIHARTLSEEDTWDAAENLIEQDAWIKSFEAYKSFTVARLSIGLKL